MKDYINLSQPIKRIAALISVCIITPDTIIAWYNPFEYDTSAETSAFGTGLQEEQHESSIEIAKTKAEKQRELQEGREAGQIEDTSKITTEREKEAAKKWEITGPEESIHADDTRIADEIEESKASALGKSKQ